MSSSQPTLTTLISLTDKNASVSKHVSQSYGNNYIFKKSIIIFKKATTLRQLILTYFGQSLAWNLAYFLQAFQKPY